MVWGSRAWSIYIFTYMYIYIYLGICIYIYVGIQVYSWCEYCWIWARAHSGAHSSARHPHRHTHRHSQHDGRHPHRDIMRHTRVGERSLDLDACMHDTRHRGRSHESRDIDAIELLNQMLNSPRWVSRMGVCTLVVVETEGAKTRALWGYQLCASKDLSK